MDRIYINSGFIKKRSAALHTTIGAPDCKAYYEKAKIAESKQLKNWDADVKYFVEHCTDTNNANRYYRQCVYFLERANERENKPLAESILKTLTERVMIYMKDPIEVNSPYIQLTEQQADKIDHMIMKYEAADRILNNHEKISKRFNINSIFQGRSKQNLNLEKTLIKVCAMIDTYDINPPAKLSLALEEVFYELQMNGIDHNPNKVVSQITEYFLNRETDISEENYTRMKSVLEECPILQERDMSDISYFTRYHDNSRNTAIQYLNRYMLNPKKNTDTLQELTESVNLLAKPKDVITGFPDIIGRIRTHMVCESSIYGIRDIDNTIRQLTGRVIERAVLEDTYSRSDVEKIRDIMVKECGCFETYCVESNDIINYNSRLYDYRETCDRCSRELTGVLEILYTDYNRDIIRRIQVESASSDPITLNEFKLFRFQNLLHMCKEVDEEIKSKSRNFIKKASTKVREVKKKLGLSEGADLYAMINSDYRFDVCVERFELASDDKITNLHEYATRICRDINRTVLCNEDTVHCYYLITDGLEFHLECTTPIIMNEEEKEIWEHTLSDEDITRCIYFDEITTTISNLNGIVDSNGWNLYRSFDRMSLEEISVMMELASYTGSFSTKTFEDLFETYKNTHNLNCLEEAKITSLLGSYQSKESVPVDIAVEAHLLMESLLESKDEEKGIKKEEKKEPPKKQSIVDRIKSNIPGNKDRDKEKEEDEGEEKEKKNPFKGISFNSLKLYCAGLKKKFKDMSSKEKELSRNLDTAVARLSKGMKDALVSDRREAIIKGSVIPSFSKCVKLSTAVAGIGILNPPLALFTVIGGFIMSKKLTKQERLLMLDEIETELEVVEKEIELAQSKNQIKKYRKLLQWKKQLQREYQRIRYNIKIGKDMLPGSSNGVKSND